MSNKLGFGSGVIIGATMTTIVMSTITIDMSMTRDSKSPIQKPGEVVNGKPRERYYRGDVVKLNNGLEGTVFDKRYCSMESATSTFPRGNFWAYKIHLLNNGILQQVVVNESEIAICLKESSTRPPEYKTKLAESSEK